jgi:hypothetical protein
MVPPPHRECREPATWIVAFPDGDTAHACEPCMLRVVEIAKSHGTVLQTKRIA